MEWVETTGDSVTEAKAAAVDLLGIAADEAEFEIINEERKNFLGRVKDQARIRARVRPTAPRPKQERGERSRGKRRGGDGGGDRNRSKKGRNDQGRDKNRSGDRPKQERSSGRRDSGRDRAESGNSRPKESVAAAASSKKPSEVSTVTEPMSLPRQGEVMSEFLGGALRAFGLEGRIEATEVDETTLEVNVAGPDLGMLIGPRGNTLRALQELARTVVQRKSGGDAVGRVRIDIAGYRERRRQALSAFTTEVAERVVSSGDEQALEPMSAADRKIVHDTVQDIDGVDTISEGSEPDRRVVIVPAD